MYIDTHYKYYTEQILIEENWLILPMEATLWKFYFFKFTL